MGYGLDTQLYNRKWGTVITWRYDPINTFPINPNLVTAMTAWAFLCGITFQQVTLATTAVDFVVSCLMSNQQSGWLNHPPNAPAPVGGANGKPLPGVMGKLSIKPDSSLGSILHEIGHVLGLSHEQDHPDYRATYYGGNELNLAAANLTANKYKLKKYGSHDASSVMMYPHGNNTGYKLKVAPSPGDVAAVKAINGWP